MSAMTELLNSTTMTTMTPDGGTVFIRPTPIERQMGRLMRAPDHPADAPPADTPPADAPPANSPPADTPPADAPSLMGGIDSPPADAPPADTPPAADEPVVPEAYDLKLTTKQIGEDGKEVDAEVEMDPVLLEAATPILKELKLSNEQANSLAPLALKVQERMAQQQADAHEATVADWAKEAKADPELGGKNWSVTETNVARALDHFVGPREITNEDGTKTVDPFRKLLDDSGLGNHPTLIRAFNKIGAAMGEDMTFVRSDAGAQVQPSREATLYPNMVKASE